MTIQEIAQDRDVPFFETCQELDWKDKTFFYWCIAKSHNEIRLCYLDRDGLYRDVDDHEYVGNTDGDDLIPLKLNEHGEDIFAIPAPIAKQIAALLPDCIETKKWGLIKKDFNQYRLVYGFNTYEELVEIDELFVPIPNAHFSQQYAELYLKLKSENLLKNG